MADRADHNQKPEPEILAGINTIQDATVGASVQARSIQGNIVFNAAPPAARPTPAQLPICPSHFTNREREIATLERLARDAAERSRTMLAVITGQGGIGKTTLGLCWLQHVSDRYPDGQLYVDLQGFSGISHLTPEEGLTSLLRSLGMAAADIPISTEDQSALFRSLTAGRRFIIVLDNAVSAAQVRPLLPGNGPSVVIVTARRQLSGLAMHGASFLELEPLDRSDASSLLTRMLGRERTAAEPDEVLHELADLCGRLPLALCTSAARLTTRRRWRISRLVDELNDERRRLAALHIDDDLSVRAVFDASYSALSADAAAAYRLLGLHPGPDFALSLAAAVTGFGDERTARVLDVLLDANLIQEHADHRFRFHDLVRLHAQSTVEREESPAAREAARRRIIRHYLRSAAAADVSVIPGRWRLGGHHADDVDLPRMDRERALTWLESERPNLTAALRLAHDTGQHRETWEFCEALWPLFVHRKHYGDWLSTHELGLSSARACGDRLAEARMLEQLGSAHLNLKDFTTALTCAAQAVELERAADHTVGEATALEIRGVAELALGRPGDAIETFTRSRELNERIDVPRAVAIMTRHLGDALRAADRAEESVRHLLQAQEFFRDNGDGYNEARSLNGLARSYLELERIDEAEQALRAVVGVTESIGAPHEAANAHVGLADVAARRGRPGEERAHLESALAVYERHGAPEADEVRRRLDRIPPPGSS
ncbi:tetratricopeptide repeat protein [Actinoallomurus sp. CA-150999]|uniref:tetratricopeptide repeat protein n=1 Tax=Actinoallomurus sp. CA-150999 TaxID=3239887 RepID=UPI003D93BA07